MKSVEDINKKILELRKNNHSVKDISDVYHTFGDYVKMRNIYFTALCNAYPNISWKSKKHFDEENDPMFNGDFIAGINTTKGPIAQHIKLELWDKLHVSEINRGLKYDGYTEEDIIKRVDSLNSIECKELLAVYNELGERTDKIVLRGAKDESFAPNERIGVALIYIENSNNEFLIQKISKQKGGIYSSTAGHIRYNETPLETIIREVKEELGIDISNENIVDLGHLVVDFPVRFIFYLKKDIDLNDIILQKEEVESVSYMSEEEIRNVINKGLMHKAHLQILDRVLEKRLQEME